MKLFMGFEKAFIAKTIISGSYICTFLTEYTGYKNLTHF